MKKILCCALICFSLCSGCEDTNMRLATEAGVDAVKALTLSEDQVRQLSARTAKHLDAQHELAPAHTPYAQRLDRLFAKHQNFEGESFHSQVYLSSKVNAFALADGNIRVYAGLMDILSDEELLFVLGHEMGHVHHDHVQEKMRVALAGKALRKGVASQQNIIGDLARSTLGAFIQALLNAQFSQQEEKEADDYGLRFVQHIGLGGEPAVSALNKLAELGNEHSFLSSHPAPGKRAQRLQKQMHNPDSSEQEPGLLQRVFALVHSLIELLLTVLRWVAGLIVGSQP